MKTLYLLFGLLAVAPAAFSAETITYEKLAEYSRGDGRNNKAAIGKSVQIAVVGKGELGYFANAKDDVTFACDRGDKTLTAYKAKKGAIQGVVTKATGWEATTVWTLKDCQFVTAAR